MHSLQEKLVVVALEIEDPFHSQHLVAEFADQRTEPDANFQAVELARLLDADGVYILQMVVVMTPLVRVTMVALWTVMMAIMVVELNGELNIVDIKDSREVHL